MGHSVYHAIVVSGWKAEAIKEAHLLAVSLDMSPTEIVKSPWEGVTSFLVPPDGSKEGWEESDDGDSRRERFIGLLKSKWDGKWWDWVEVAFGADEREEPRIESSSAEAKEEDEPDDG